MRIVPSIDADAVVLKVETSGVGIPTKKAERKFDEILAGPQGTQRLVSSSRRAVQTVGARPPGPLAHNITCPQRVVCCLVAAAAFSLPVRRPASKDSPARRCSPWASSLCVDSRRVLHGNSVPREFMVVHFVIDGAVVQGGAAPGTFTPQAIARSYMAALAQPLGAWSWEMELRSHSEPF